MRGSYDKLPRGGKNFLSGTLRTQSREALALNIRVIFSVSCRLLLLLEENFPR